MDLYMINLVKHVLSKHCTLLMKMALDALTISFAKSIFFSLLTNMEILLGLNVMMSLLEAIHYSNKFTQLMDVFVCDFIVEMNIYMWRGCVLHVLWKVVLFWGYVFNNFITLINTTHESINIYCYRFKHQNESFGF
jgi:hypothetical protein